MKCGPSPSRACVEDGASTQLRRKNELPITKRVRSGIGEVGGGKREGIAAVGKHGHVARRCARPGARRRRHGPPRRTHRPLATRERRERAARRAVAARHDLLLGVHQRETGDADGAGGGHQILALLRQAVDHLLDALASRGVLAADDLAIERRLDRARRGDRCRDLLGGARRPARRRWRRRGRAARGLAAWCRRAACSGRATRSRCRAHCSRRRDACCRKSTSARLPGPGSPAPPRGARRRARRATASPGPRRSPHRFGAAALEACAVVGLHVGRPGLDQVA